MECICTSIILILFGITYIQTQAVDKDGYCTNSTTVVKTTNGTVNVEKKFCCRHYEKHPNNECKECKTGYTSDKGKPCHKCEGVMYGNRCSLICKCQDNERCDHVQGCIAIGGATTYNSDDKKNDNRGVADHKSTDYTVVIYMTCVAVLGLLVVATIIVWKFRHTIYLLMSSWKNRFACFGPPPNSQQAKLHTEDTYISSECRQENIYDVINEKEMITVCKTY